MLLPSIHHSLDEMSALLRQLSDGDYTQPCPALSHATIGEHTRHIIEMFQCLENSYAAGAVNYDKRQRNLEIQTQTAVAILALEQIAQGIDKPNKPLQLQQIIDGNEFVIESNYFRELLYNLEHCIHHQALIKVAVHELDHVEIDANFGVARSTIEYRKQCAP